MSVSQEPAVWLPGQSSKCLLSSDWQRGGQGRGQEEREWRGGGGGDRGRGGGRKGGRRKG